MSLLEIVDVSLSPPEPERLRGRHIDVPKQGTRAEAAVLDVSGWALGHRSSAVAVELVDQGRVIRRAPLGVPRPDLSRAFPEFPEAGRAGFRTTVSVLGRTALLELEVRAVLRDHTRVPVGVIRARRCWQEVDARSEGALVSVIIPCYNQAHFLPQAIESVLGQSYPHVEVVVVDDGSTDNTAEVAARYPGVRCVGQDNQGLAAARNTGIRRSTGDYLVFLDADDRLLPEALDIGLARLEQRPECAFTAGLCNLMAFDGSPLRSNPPTVDEDPYLALLRGAPIWAPATVMYRRSVFRTVGGFDPSIAPAADYDLYYRIARDHPVDYHDTPVALYRRHGTNMTRDPLLMLEANVRALRAQRRGVRGANERAAYREGLRYWRSFYGSKVADRVRHDIRQGRWIESARGVFGMLHHHPSGLPMLVKGGSRA